MFRDFQKEVTEAREDVMAAMRAASPSREFGAALILATVWLHVIEARIRKTNNLEERRCLTNEFNTRRDAIRNGIRALQAVGQRSGEAPAEQEPRHAVS